MKKKQIKEFEELVRPVIQFLDKNFHPHVKIIIENDHAEIVEGITGFTAEYKK